MAGLDDIDRALINELMNNPRVDMEELKNIVNGRLHRNLSISTIYQRRNKLFESGLLREVLAPDYGRVGKSTLCFIGVKFSGHDEHILEEFTKIPEVMEVHAVGGQYDVFLKVRGSDIENIANLVFRIRTDYPIVKATEIFIALRTKKETLSVGV